MLGEEIKYFLGNRLLKNYQTRTGNRKIKYILLIFIFALGLCFLLNCASLSPEKKVVTITITTWDDAESQKVRESFVREFERTHPHIRVKFIDIPANRYYQKLLTMIAAGTPPDAAYLAYDNIPSFASKGAIIPLDTFLEKEKEPLFSDYYPRVVEMLKFNNKIYGVPRDFTVFALYYNKDIFDKEGVEYPNANWDWKKFIEVAKKLTKDTDGDGKIDQFAFTPEPWLDSYIYWIWQNGGEILSEDLKECIIDHPETIEALQFVADMRTKYKIAPSLMYSQQPGQAGIDLFSTGKLAMYVNGSWVIGVLRRQAKFNWDVAPVPKGPKGRATVLFTVAMVIPKGSPHPNEAWEFLKYLGGLAGQSFFGSATIGRGIPAIKSIAESSVFINRQLPPEHIDVLLEAADKYAYPLRLHPRYYDILAILDVSLDELWIGKKTAKQITKEIKPKIDAILKEPVK